MQNVTKTQNIDDKSIVTSVSSGTTSYRIKINNAFYLLPYDQNWTVELDLNAKNAMSVYTPTATKNTLGGMEISTSATLNRYVHWKLKYVASESKICLYRDNNTFNSKTIAHENSPLGFSFVNWGGGLSFDYKNFKVYLG